MKNLMKIGTLFLLMVVSSLSLLAQSQGLTKTEFTLISDRTVSLGAGASDTLASQAIAIEGDSLAFLIEASNDSVSGSGLIQYLSPNQFSDTTTFAYYATAVTLVNNAKAGFGSTITHTASQQWARIWLISKNNKVSTQSIRVKIYRVRRR